MSRLEETTRPNFNGGNKEFRIKVDTVDTVPLGNECYVSLKLQDSQFEAFVPISTIIDHGIRVISCMLVGNVGNNVVISFAASSMGTAIWTMPKEAMEKITVSES